MLKIHARRRLNGVEINLQPGKETVKKVEKIKKEETVRLPPEWV